MAWLLGVPPPPSPLEASSLAPHSRRASLRPTCRWRELLLKVWLQWAAGRRAGPNAGVPAAAAHTLFLMRAIAWKRALQP